MPRAGRLPWQCATGGVRRPCNFAEATIQMPLARHLLGGHNNKNDEAFPRKTRWRGHAALATHETLHRMQAPEAAQRLLAPCCLRRRARPLVRRVPGRLLPELVCGAPQRVQHAAARLLPPEPRPPARLQPRVSASPPPPDAHRALEAPPRRGVSSRGLRPRGDPPPRPRSVRTSG